MIFQNHGWVPVALILLGVLLGVAALWRARRQTRRERRQSAEQLAGELLQELQRLAERDNEFPLTSAYRSDIVRLQDRVIAASEGLARLRNHHLKERHLRLELLRVEIRGLCAEIKHREVHRAMMA